MPAKLIDGSAVARGVYAALEGRVRALAARGVRPGLAAVRFGDDAAAAVYVRNKARACNAAGLHSEVHHHSAGVSQAEALAVVDRLNADPAIHGILVQLPLPDGLDRERIMQAVAPHKDVDGFGWRNLGALLDARARFEPCTPLGVLTLLDHAGVSVEGSHAVIVGRSSIVGKPLALMLLNRNATVTVCHTKTRALEEHTRRADILVAAAGRPGVITAAMIKPGAALIDVGINRLSDGKLAGDVDFASASSVAGWLTPVPGGVGPMTVAMLISNTVRAAEMAHPG